MSELVRPTNNKEIEEAAAKLMVAFTTPERVQGEPPIITVDAISYPVSPERPVLSALTKRPKLDIPLTEDEHRLLLQAINYASRMTLSLTLGIGLTWFACTKVAPAVEAVYDQSAKIAATFGNTVRDAIFEEKRPEGYDHLGNPTNMNEYVQKHSSGLQNALNRNNRSN